MKPIPGALALSGNARMSYQPGQRCGGGWLGTTDVLGALG